MPASPPDVLGAPGNRLGDGVVFLAPIQIEDAVTVMAWDADPDVQRWFDWPLMAATAETHAARLATARQTVRNKWAGWRAGTEYTFIIRTRDAVEGVGWIDLQPRGSGRGNVGYGILPGARRKGVATRAVLLASRYAFGTLGWDRLELCAIADNVASTGVAVRAGFQLDGVLRSYGAYEKHEPLLGQRFDWAIYSRLSSDELTFEADTVAVR